jgi:hypothetical protein
LSRTSQRISASGQWPVEAGHCSFGKEVTVTEHTAYIDFKNLPTPTTFMNLRVADIQACYELWRSRGAEFVRIGRERPIDTIV